MQMLFTTIIGIILLALSLLITPSPSFAGQLRAGVAIADITPDTATEKIPSTGYGQRKGAPMEGVHDPIRCKALVLDDGGGKAGIVTCDLGLLSPELRDRVIARIDGTGLGDQNLMMSASHTHSGPGAMMNNLVSNIGFGKYQEEHVIRTAEKIAAAIREANSRLQPVTMKVGEAVLNDVTRNRRDPAGSYNYDTRRFTDAYDPANPKNDTDQTVTAVMFEGEDGKPLAIIFHFATHPTVMGFDNMLFSADWPGAAQAKLEAAYPGAAALYMNGAQGDQAPTMLYDEKTDWEYVDLIGGQVANGVMDALANAKPVASSPVRAELVRREVDPASRIYGIYLGKSYVKKILPSFTFQAVRVGDVVFMGCPFEMVSVIGRTMKAGAKGQGAPYPIVVGLANGHAMYCASPEDFPEGGYEVEITVWGIDQPGLVIGEQMMLVNKIMSSE